MQLIGLMFAHLRGHSVHVRSRAARGCAPQRALFITNSVLLLPSCAQLARSSTPPGAYTLLARGRLRAGLRGGRERAAALRRGEGSASAELLRALGGARRALAAPGRQGHVSAVRRGAESARSTEQTRPAPPLGVHAFHSRRASVRDPLTSRAYLARTLLLSALRHGDRRPPPLRAQTRLCSRPCRRAAARAGAATERRLRRGH